MDFRDSPEEENFRREAADWLDRALEELPAPRDGTQEERERNARWWQERLHEGGWAGITYPEEYGGRGLGVVEQAIFNQEAARRDAPTPINLLGNILAGPTILMYGTDEQKRRFIPKILSGEEVWCQGFSEPNAGSDLASLRTRAQEVEGGYAVTGQKVWTSFGHSADRCMLLARTRPLDQVESKHAGITYFCATMEQVDVRPLVMINGEADFNEMFLEDVFVADDDVLGEPGAGWQVALTTLAFERGSLAFVTSVVASRALEHVIDRVRDRGLDRDPVVRDQIGGLHARVEALRVGTVRQLSKVSAGQTPGAEGSALKLSWARVMQDLTRLALEIGGIDGIVLDGSDDGRWPSGYLRARGNSVEGGTDEIQRSIIAERVLGLPRSR